MIELKSRERCSQRASIHGGVLAESMCINSWFRSVSVKYQPKQLQKPIDVFYFLELKFMVFLTSRLFFLKEMSNIEQLVL